MRGVPDLPAYAAIIAGMAIVTFTPRLLPLLGFSRLRLPPRVEQALAALGPALLSALLAQELFGSGLPTPRALLAVGAALGAGVASRNLAVAVAAGLLMGALLHRLPG